MYDTIKFVIKESELDNAICFLEEIQIGRAHV